MYLPDRTMLTYTVVCKITIIQVIKFSSYLDLLS